MCPASTPSASGPVGKHHLRFTLGTPQWEATPSGLGESEGGSCVSPSDWELLGPAGPAVGGGEGKGRASSSDRAATVPLLTPLPSAATAASQVTDAGRCLHTRLGALTCRPQVPGPPALPCLPACTRQELAQFPAPRFWQPLHTEHTEQQEAEGRDPWPRTASPSRL